MPYTLKTLCEELQLTFSGNGDLPVTHVCGLDELTSGGIAYLSSPGTASIPTVARLVNQVSHSIEDTSLEQVVFVVAQKMEIPNHIVVEDPLVTHIRITELLHPASNPEAAAHPSAVIGNGVTLGKNISIGPHVVLGDGVSVGDGTILHAGVVVMEQTTIGDHCLIYPNAVIREQCSIGNRVILHANAVIGADGHGFFQRDGKNQKIPQVGVVILEDDVEVGACTTIDRARFSQTIVRQGCKIDNQVQIAHNVELGAQALVSAQSAIGGSTKTGHHLILGGQAGIRDHVTIGNHVTAVARAVITSNTKDSEVLGGMPSRPFRQWKHTQALIHRLAELFERVSKLEKKESSSS